MKNKGHVPLDFSTKKSIFWKVHAFQTGQNKNERWGMRCPQKNHVANSLAVSTFTSVLSLELGSWDSGIFKPQPSSIFWIFHFQHNTLQIHSYWLTSLIHTLIHRLHWYTLYRNQSHLLFKVVRLIIFHFLHHSVQHALKQETPN